MTKKDKQNLKVKYALFCDYALVSQDGKFSLIGEFDRLYSSQDTAVLNRGFLVAKIIGHPSQNLDLKVSLINDSSKEELFKNDFSLKLDDRGVAALIIELSGMQFKTFGLYKAIIESDGDKVVEVDLDVAKVKQPTVAQS